MVLSLKHFFFFLQHIMYWWDPAYIGGTFMLEEKENEEQDELEELKTYSIEEYVKMRREQSKKKTNNMKKN